MTQTQRDLTYRLDALKSICETSGYQSEICQSSIGVWTIQHDMNVRMEKFAVYNSWFSLLFWTLLICFFIYIAGFSHCLRNFKPHTPAPPPPRKQL